MKHAVLVLVSMLAAIGCAGEVRGRAVGDSGRPQADGALTDGGRRLDAAAPSDSGSPGLEDAQADDASMDDADIGDDRAVIASHTLPTNLACTESTTVRVTVRNAGDTTWTREAGYGLGAVDPEDVLLITGDAVDLGSADAVAPGGEHTFEIALSAPGAGAYTTTWRMVRAGVHWFGDVATSSVVVTCDGPFSVYPSVIDGAFDMPEHPQRIASRDASLVRLGHPITGDDAIDNAVLGGGSPDGGIWLSGRFHFEIDAAGQSTDASWITVFSDERYPLTGGVYPNGEIHMGSPAGLDISGLLKNGVVTGYVAEAGMSITFEGEDWSRLPLADRNYIRGIWHGAELEYVHGVMSGAGAVE